MKVIVEVNLKENKVVVNNRVVNWNILDYNYFVFKLLTEMVKLENINSELKNDIGYLASLDVVNNTYIAELLAKDETEDMKRFVYEYTEINEYVNKKIMFLKELKKSLSNSQYYRKMRLRKSKNYFDNADKFTEEEQLILAKLFRLSVNKVSSDLTMVSKKINFIDDLIMLFRELISFEYSDYVNNNINILTRLTNIRIKIDSIRENRELIYLDRNKDLDKYMKWLIKEVGFVN